MVDIDGTTATGGFNDNVQFTPVPTSASFVGSNVNYNAGTGRASTNGSTTGDTSGDLRVCFAGPVSNVSVQHIAADITGATDPALQIISIDDLTFGTVSTLTLTKTSVGAVGAFAFNASNGFGAQTLTTLTSGATIAGVTRTLTAVSTATTITETVPAGYALTATCTGMASGGTATLAGAVLTLDAAATASRSDIVCNFTNIKLPTVQITKISNGGVGPFTFNGTNGFGAAQTVTTVTSGTGVAGAVVTLGAASTSTVLTETIPTGYTLTAATCTGIGAGSATADLATGTITLSAAATAPGNVILCTFTNATTTLRAQKTRAADGAGGVNFSFTGSNGYTADTIASTASATVAGSARILAAPGTSTTLTETAVAGWTVTAIACTGMGAGGAATVDLPNRTVTLNAAATALGSSVVCTFTNQRRTTIQVTKTSIGNVGTFSFSAGNGYGSDSITTAVSGTNVAGAIKTVTANSTALTITEAAVPGYALTAASCTGAGAAPTVNLAARTVAFTNAGVGANLTIVCTFTNTKQLPTVQASKISLGAVGAFNFTGTNGYAADTVTTVTSGVAVSGNVRALTAAGVATTITETIPAGYAVANISCTGLGAGTATPNLGAGSVLLNTTATAAANDIVCTFTNAKLPTVTVTKVSNGGVGPFTFNSTPSNGFASQTITTATSGVGVAGAAQTLTAASTATTITETVPSGYLLASASCTGLGAGGNASLAGNVLTLDAAATPPGAAIACTFTNALVVSQLSILKTANTAGPVAVNDVITYTYTVTNSGNVPITGITVNDIHNGYGAAPVVTNEVINIDVAPLGNSTDAGTNGSWDTLAPGDSIKFTWAYTVTQQDVDLLQ